MLRKHLLSLAAVISLASGDWVPFTWEGQQYSCKCGPQDTCWPAVADWKALNASVDGNLILNIPPGAVCHDTFNGIDTFDAAACALATSMWTSEQWQISQPAAQLWTYGSNNTCELTTDSSEPCTLGFYSDYVLLAKTPLHVKAGIDFARSHNIRLVIRNTGHDFEGRSAGAGSLAINMHAFQDIEFVDRYETRGYLGPAVKIGAGVQGFTLLEAASRRSPPQTVVTGECGTVGIAGGFIQGGGHGPLTSLYGFAADNALTFDVITADGRLLTASPFQNEDLFYALKGGGPSTYAVVLSVTLKTYPDNLPSAGLWFNVNATIGADFNTHVLKAMAKVHELTNHFVDHGLYGIYELWPPAIMSALHVQPIMGLNMSGAQLDAIVKPLFDYFDAEGIPYDTGTKEFSNWYSLYKDLFEAEPAAQNGLTGGWVFTREDLTPDHANDLAEAVKIGLSPRPDLIGIVISHFFDPGYTVKQSMSATHPGWRGASLRMMTILPTALNATWEQKVDYDDVMVNTISKALIKAGPKGLAYVNENYWNLPNWQEAFWGSVYPTLKTAKAKWDPEGLFYAVSTPGTEAWNSVDYGGRLCKAASS